MFARTTNHPQWKIQKEGQEFQEWELQQRSFSSFIDGASRKNPGAAGARKSLHDPKGTSVLSFAGALANYQITWQRHMLFCVVLFSLKKQILESSLFTKTQ
jgi:hypothetical protein